MPQQTDERRAKLVQEVTSIVEGYDLAKLGLIQGVVEEVMIRSAITASKTYNDAASRLGIGKSTMYRKMKEYGIPNKRADHLARSGERDAPRVTLPQGVCG